jgi:hypothetical protein
LNSLISFSSSNHLSIMLWCVLCGTFGCEQHWWGLMPCDTNYYHTCCGALADDILSQKLKPAGHLKPPQATSSHLGLFGSSSRSSPPSGSRPTPQASRPVDNSDGYPTARGHEAPWRSVASLFLVTRFTDTKNRSPKHDLRSHP